MATRSSGRILSNSSMQTTPLSANTMAPPCMHTGSFFSVEFSLHDPSLLLQPYQARNCSHALYLHFAGNSIHQDAHIDMMPLAGQRLRPITHPARFLESMSGFFLVITCIWAGYDDSSSTHQPQVVRPVAVQDVCKSPTGCMRAMQAGLYLKEELPIVVLHHSGCETCCTGAFA